MHHLRALLLAALLARPALAQPEPTEFTPAQSALLDREIHQMIDSKNTPSASVAVVHHGQIVYSGAFGFANTAQHIQATPQTRYHIGSTSKIFTALAIMQQIEAGKLSLDDRLERFQPNFPNAKNITVRHLLTHRSGIPNYLDDALNSQQALQPTTPQAIVAMMAKLPGDPPGAKYSYSNTNFVILGLIVENLSGTPLYDYYATHIFAPAGMTRTSAGGPTALGYSGDKILDPGHVSWYYACGDLNSTAEDLARLDIALMEGRIVKPETLAQMQKESLPTTENGSAGYGLGMSTFQIGARTLLGHHGGVPGYEADDEMILQDRFAIVALGNDFGFNTSQILKTVLQNSYPQEIVRATERSKQYARERLKREQPELTARFTLFMVSISLGKPPEGDLTQALRDGLTNARAETHALYGNSGALQKLEYVDDTEAGGYHRYHYRAVFAQETRDVTFVLDNHGKLAGLLNR